MTPQERDLIQGVFDRLSRSGIGQKDFDAEALIAENFRRLPDAAYGLVQAVIMQEMGLNQATSRIAELQRQLDEARAGARASSSGGGGFLSGLNPFASAPAAPRPSPWAAAAAAPAYAPPPAPAYAPPPGAAGPWAQPPAQPSAAGGFLRNAATMAAGVAGGTLIAEGLSSLFGGHHYGGGFGGGYGGGFGGAGPWAGGQPEVVENVTVNNYYDERGRAVDNVSDDGGQDASYQDASYDDSGFDGGDSGFDDTSDI